MSDTLFFLGDRPYVKKHGAKICLNCPLEPDACNNLMDQGEAKRLINPPDCLISFAYWAGWTLKQAEVIWLESDTLENYYARTNRTIP